MAHPVLGRFIGPSSYRRIRDAFCAPQLSVSDLVVDTRALPFSTEEIDRASAILSRHGVVMLPCVVDSTLVQSAREEADRLSSAIRTASAGSDLKGQVLGLDWRIDAARAASSDALAARNLPVANMRTRTPGDLHFGVIDIFGIDRVARDNGWRALRRCCRYLASETLARIVAAVSPWRRIQFNLLRHDSATVTRGLHVDNLKNFYKVFLYLSDVASLDSGPYAYVPGTHARPDLLRREERLNSVAGTAIADSHAFKGMEIPFLGPAGTLIISCQSGVHRGLPQRAGASRTVLIAKYRD